jgi:hypothetical protein
MSATTRLLLMLDAALPAPTSRRSAICNDAHAMRAQARLAMVHSDWALARERVAEARALNEKGGDWDRRNRLKVYEAVVCLVMRGEAHEMNPLPALDAPPPDAPRRACHVSRHADFKRASELLLDSVATFTAVEIFDYPSLVLYTVLTGLKELERPALKKRVVDSPDVLSALSEAHPHLPELLHALYEGRYAAYMSALVGVYPALQADRYLAPHASFYLREMRLAGYRQYLESYKSVTLAGMAAAFGVAPGFLDGELSRFISTGRLNAKIDAVDGASGNEGGRAAAAAARDVRGVCGGCPKWERGPAARTSVRPGVSDMPSSPQVSLRRRGRTPRTRNTLRSSRTATRCSTRCRSSRASSQPEQGVLWFNGRLKRAFTWNWGQGCRSGLSSAFSSDLI